MRASRSEGLRPVSIFTCWASAGGAGATTTASSTATIAIRIGMTPSYTKIAQRRAIARASAAAEDHELAHRLEAVEVEHGAFERGDPRGGQRTPRVVAEFLDDGLGRQRALQPATAVRQARLELLPVPQAHTHPAGKALRKRRFGIHHVAHARGQREHARIVQVGGRVRVEADGAIDECRGDRKRQAELRIVRASWPTLGLRRLADDRHLTGRNPALDALDGIDAEAWRASQLERAIQIGVVEMAARVRLVADAERLPLATERVERPRIRLGAQERTVQAEAALQDRRRTRHPAAGEPSGERARVAGPTRMQPLDPRPVLEVLHDAGG